jgi:hypothetical protein
VRIALQDAVSGEFRVQIQNDRLLTAAQQQAPIPVVEAGRTGRQFVVLESAGRDEVEVLRHPGLEPLGRQQQQWAELAKKLSGNITQAYLVTAPSGGAGVAAGANTPQLVLQTRERKALETARAKIGLAFTDLVLDANGAYRAELTCHIDNSTEQYLEIELPEGATLWTAQVAGTPVKPTLAPAGSGKGAGRLPAGRVRIPLVKTAPGELDYAVVLKYGGQMGPVGRLADVQFPLVRVLRIPVELSQVDLHLPETHAWLHFGGTMGQVDEAEQAAAQVAYQTKVVDRLKQDLSSSNPFAQARAANNLKQVGQAALSQRQMVRAYQGNAKLQEELARNESVLKEAELAVDQVQQAPQQEAAVQDNRYLMNQRFLEQRAQVSGNEVKSAGRNWDPYGGEQQAAEPSKPAQYNPEWLEQNDRGKESGDQGRSGKPGKDVQAGFKERVLKGAGGKFKAAKTNEPPAEPQVQLLLSDASSSASKPGGGQQANGQQANQRYPVADLVVPVLPPSSQSGVGVGRMGGIGGMGPQAANPAQAAFQPPQRADTQQAKASRYQQEQLQRQLANPPQSGRNDDVLNFTLRGEGGRGASSSSAQPGRDQVRQEQGSGSFEYVEGPVVDRLHGLTAESGAVPPAGAAGRSEPAATALALLPFLNAGQPSGGLASLDVALPRRGTVYHFSTPRGDAEITAQAVSGRLVAGLGQAGAVVLAALVVWYVFALIRRGRFAWLASRRTATVLLIAGALAFCFFPGMAILAIAAGSGILVRSLVGTRGEGGGARDEG